MTIRYTFAKIIAAVTGLLFLTACGDHSGHGAAKTGPSVTAGSLTISDGWARAAQAPAKTSAVYFEIENSSAMTDQLVAVSTEMAEVSEVHQSLEEDGVSMMRRIRELEVPGDGQVSLEPGGYHIMLINLTQSIEAGDTVPVTLTFTEAGDVVIEAVARSSDGGGHDHHAGH